jgi:transglutaminase-like putative cysteine protease
VIALVLAAALNACAALALHRVVPMGALLPMVALAILPPVLLARLLARASLWLALPASAIAWLLVTGAGIVHRDAAFAVLPTVDTLRDIGAGLRDSWSELVTTILPAPAEPRLMVALSVPPWLASAASAELAARTRSALLPVVPPLLLLAAAVLVGVPGTGSNLDVAIGFVALAAGLALARQQRTSLRRLMRRYAAGAPVVALVAVVAGLAGPHLPLLSQRKPFDIRRHVTTAGVPRASLNPLDQVSAWLGSPGALFTAVLPAGAGATAGGTGAAPTWRIASLDGFDGRTWYSTGRFVPTGSRVPLPEASPTHTSRLIADVTVEGLTGPWLPTVESPTAVTGLPVMVDPATGVVLSRDGLGPEVRYRVDAEVPQYGGEQLRLAAPGRDAQAQAALALPHGLPDEVADQATRATQNATFPAQQASQLASYLRANEHNDPTAAPGHSYGHIAYFLTVSHRGTTEQFATAFAVMARSIGLPTRVVVGFTGGLPDPTGHSWTVRGSDVLVWPEVDFAGVGWVPFFPTPVTGTSPNDPAVTAAAGASSQRQAIDQDLDDAGTTDVRVPDARRHDGQPTGGAPGRSWWSLLPILPGAILVYLLAVLLAPVLRTRRRRRARRGTGQVAGAWAELLHRLGPLRLGDVSALSAGEVAAAAERRAGRDAGAHLGRLATLADAAAFSGAPLPPPYGVQAWRHLEAATPAIRRAAGRRRRLLHRLRPRMLFR